ncbi:phosphoenolpyruvate synthase [Candidatus Microgenomates bacterium]|nr:phosphoenolpyruvate synthase [Candidatus Microgenomates bacterium]
MVKNKNIVWFDEIDHDDIGMVGGKGANLGEMLKSGIPVPFGFVVTSYAYFNFLEVTQLKEKIKHYLTLLKHKDPKNLQQTSENIRRIIVKEKIPAELAGEIMTAYLALSKRAKKSSKLSEKLTSLFKLPYVAVRSSATAEDLPTASFAGQQETFLNISGESNVVRKVQEAWASLFTPRAIFYREEQKFDHLKVGIAVPVQLMVNSETSGVMFTVDPMTNDKNRIVIEGIYGLGELIVQGSVTPDHFSVDKKTNEILERKIACQTKMLVKKDGKTKEVNISQKTGGRQKISDHQIKEIARLGKLLEKHYFFPQDVEWAIEKGKIFIVQTRPITTYKKQGQKEENKTTDSNKVTQDMQILLTGDPASPGIASGSVKIITDVREIGKVYPGDVMVTEQTNPDYVPAMKRAVAIVTEKGGRTSHAAIVSRELGIPAVVGTGNATKVLKNGEFVTVNGAKGEIYKGALTSGQKIELRSAMAGNLQSPIFKTATKIYVNMASPDRVVEVSKMNFDGIGLLRAEFMIADIGTHPRKLIKEHKEKLFISKLAADLLKFCQAFSPRPVMYRATDFKPNEYRNLTGGREFEPEEPNPMLGFRGVFRYIKDPKVFELELEAIKMVRNVYGFRNLHLMLPFVRTVAELIEIKKIIAACKLLRSPSFKLWLMVEIPSNVILIDKFCEAGIDGVSIGSNDLTMLILGTDRDNTEVAREFDERNEAVTWAIERVVKACHKYKITSSICGQAASDYPELVEKMVSWGITSVSVNPDAYNHIKETVYNAEKKLVNKK